MTTTFTPGEAVAICGESARMLVGIRIDDPRLPQLWDAVRPSSATAVDGVLGLLLDEGFGAMPAFAVVTGDAATARVVVRHPAVVEAVVDGTPVTLTATPGGTWADVTLEGATSFVLRADAGVGTTVQLPLHVGVTPAGAVTVAVASADAALAPDEAAPIASPTVDEERSQGEVAAATPPRATTPGAPQREPVTAPAEDVPDDVADELDEPTGDAADDPDPLAARAQTFHALLTSDTSDRDALLAQLAEEPAEPDAPATTAVDEEVSAPATSLTAVWKADDPVASDDQTDEADEPEEAATPAAGSAPAPAPAPSNGLIDGVPWLRGDWTPPPAEERRAPSFETPARPAPPPAPAAKQPEPAAEGREQQTLNRADLLKELGSAGIVGPSVLAVDCPAGHPTPAHEPTCRLCGTPVSDSQEPRQIPRPALGALVLANGDRLVLDKDAVLGRAPFEPEGSTERPHLLRVGESGEISRQHARITLDGWHVIVRDLGTANGTTLTLPGGSPQQLRAHEDYQLENGAEIGIADIVTLRYEVRP
ncbi:FHA domain-containing protein [Nocardioides jiangxiensis]|uniref:FHA domain-containing protein n=1 Tax=Nocardioides jiangxiensis TaxID=3064524 RepID=A0ABT9AZ73_9ACTN|nr:FHA domain-containing protein [Nocardioides sp. WY-20]MDO7867834.1 FHA domain-containing protein [Nocardioides sp. WY-20]